MNHHLTSALLVSLVVTSAAFAQIPLSAGVEYTQDFDSMTAGEPFPNVYQMPVDPPAGWAFEGNGANVGDLDDRALGIEQTPVAAFGAEFLILDGGAHIALQISFTGEQWYQSSGHPDSHLDFEWSTDTTSLTTGTWIPHDPFDFQRPGPTLPLGDRAIDGNDPVHRRELAGAVVLGDIPDDTTVWLRWTGIPTEDPPGQPRHDGLAVDDFSITSLTAVVFSDDFESGDVEAWSSAVR